MKINKGNKAPEKATKIFTDRKEPREAFWKKYELLKDKQAKEDVHVLSYYGIGGIGKTTLLEKLGHEMEERLANPRYVYFNLYTVQESRAVLEQMKNKIADRYDFSFPLFELGCYAYAKKIGQKAESLEVKQFAEKSPILSLMLSTVENIPIVGLAAQVLAIVDQGLAYIRTHLKNHSEELKQIEQMEAKDLYHYLPCLFAEDMISNVGNLEEPFVIFLDTYECLVNELSQIGEPLKNDEWIRNGLVQKIPNVLWVIAGREKLKWEYFDKDWKDALEQHILGNLSFADSDSYMKYAGITDDGLRKKLHQLTGGTPLYLDLCVVQYGKIVEKGETPDITMFGDNTRTLIERFVRYMGDSQKDLVYMLACLEQWNDEIINDVAFSILPNFSLSSYEKSKSFSFVTELDNGYYRIHQTVGEVLFDDCPQSIKMRTADSLIAHFADVVKAANYFAADYIQALTYFVRAGLMKYSDNDELCQFFERESLLENLREYPARTTIHGQTEKIWNLLRARVKPEAMDSLKAVILLDYESNEWRCLCGKEELQWDKLCKAFEKQFGDRHIYTLVAQSRLATEYRRYGNSEKALELQEKIYKIMCEVIGNGNIRTIEIMRDMVNTLVSLKQTAKATELLERILEQSCKILGTQHSITECTVIDLAYHYLFCNPFDADPGKAIVLYEKLLMEYSMSFGEEHYKTEHIRDRLSDAYSVMKQYTCDNGLLY